MFGILMTLLLAAGGNAVAATCTPAVNAELGDLIAAGARKRDNVAVCGVTISASRTQRGGPNGDHQILPLRVVFPDGSARLIEVVTNDGLDGRITAPAGAPVAAFGQFFMPAHRPFVAGLHDVHCSTHRGMLDGWVSVAGRRAPAQCPAQGR